MAARSDIRDMTPAEVLGDNRYAVVAFIGEDYGWLEDVFLSLSGATKRREENQRHAKGSCHYEVVRIAYGEACACGGGCKR